MHVHRGDNHRVTEITSDWRSRTDRHASTGSLHPAERAARAGDYYYPPDELDEFCPGCTPEQSGGRWVHDRACPARRRTA